MQHIPVVINSYLNFITYSITFINCLDKVVWPKLEEVWESWKRSKASWMGHGAWIGITWGNMGDGRMGLKHSSQNVTCFGGICFGGSGYLEIKTCVKPLVKTWHVSMGDKFWSSCFKVHVLWCVIFNRPKQMLSRHQHMTCFHVDLLQGPHYPCMETHIGPPWSKWHIYKLSLK
jgi:hypothetical protein